MGNRASKQAHEAAKRVSQSAGSVNKNVAGTPATAEWSKASSILEDGRDPQLVAKASSLGQVAITRPYTPFEADQPGVFQIKRRAEIEASDADAPNRIHARDLQTLLYAFHSGQGRQEVPQMLKELGVDQQTFDTLANSISAIDFVEPEASASEASATRGLRRAVWPSPELTASKRPPTASPAATAPP